MSEEILKKLKHLFQPLVVVVAASACLLACLALHFCCSLHKKKLLFDSQHPQFLSVLRERKRAKRERNIKEIERIKLGRESLEWKKIGREKKVGNERERERKT